MWPLFGNVYRADEYKQWIDLKQCGLAPISCLMGIAAEQKNTFNVRCNLKDVSSDSEAMNYDLDCVKSMHDNVSLCKYSPVSSSY